MSMLMLCTQWMFRVSNHVPKYHAHWENIHALGTRMYPSCKHTSKHAMNRWQSQFPKWSTYVCFIEAKIGAPHIGECHLSPYKERSTYASLYEQPALMLMDADAKHDQCDVVLDLNMSLFDTSRVSQ